MIRISNVVKFASGTPQSRIIEDRSDKAPIYYFYEQSEIEADLRILVTDTQNKKQIRTFDTVSTTLAGDIVFSLISGRATISQKAHSGYLLTQNYVKVLPSTKIEAKYMVYLLNEDSLIKRQLLSGQQGSATLKYTIRQLSDLMLPEPPSKEMQEAIGELYFAQLRLEALRKRVTELETTLVLERIKETIHHE